MFTAICCPYPDHGDLDTNWNCLSCGRQFPVIEGRPVLIDEHRSAFTTSELIALKDRRQFPVKSGLKYQLRRMLPAGNSRDQGLDLLRTASMSLPSNPTVVVIGCGFTRALHEQLFYGAELILTDVTLKGDADVACDGECLPFKDSSLDCVVIDQVLEHTINPLNVVNEIFRCLKPDGLVYSGIPFMTPVHGEPYDFQRYTPIGHRLLFRDFHEVGFMVTQGAMSALSKLAIEALGSLSDNLWFRRGVSLGVRIAAAPLLFFDRPSLRVPAATAFLGKKNGGGKSGPEIAAIITRLEQAALSSTL
jgi:SAM-dependent methyltransferase